MACLQKIQQPVWLVLGDFAELGVDSEKIHRQIGLQILQSEVQRFYAVGQQMQSAVNEFNAKSSSANRQARHFASKQALEEHLERELNSAVVVLVKGSRSQALEKVVKKITIMETVACC